MITGGQLHMLAGLNAILTCPHKPRVCIPEYTATGLVRPRHYPPTHRGLHCTSLLRMALLCCHCMEGGRKFVNMSPVNTTHSCVQGPKLVITVSAEVPAPRPLWSFQDNLSHFCFWVFGLKSWMLMKRD